MRILRSVVRVWKDSLSFTHPGRYWWFCLIRRLGLSERVRFRFLDCAFWLFPTGVIRNMYCKPEIWPPTQEIIWLRRVLRAGEVYVDIGANVGSHAICVAKHLGRSGKVYAFEPHPLTFQRLQANIRLNQLSNIEAHNVALGDAEGEIGFSDLMHDDRNRVICVEQSPGIRVPIRRLDSYAFAHLPITILKIDTEGYELHVLRGGEQALRHSAMIWVEASDKNLGQFDHTADMLANFLLERGWSLFRWVGPEDLETVHPPVKVDKTQNWIGVRSVEWLIERVPMRIRETR